VVTFASDATVQGGAMGRAGCKAVLVAYERALADNVPIVGLWHSGGARLAEGVVSLHAVGEVFAIMTRASGKIPQISIVIGAAAGGAAYGPALTDIVILGPDGRIFVTGPDVVRSVTGENVDALRLGGPEPHGRRSGVVHVVTQTTEAAYERGRLLCSLLGDQGTLDVAAVQDRDLAATFPESARRAYDVHPLVADVLDAAEHNVELHPRWAPNITTTLGRFGGRTVGVVANNPMRLGGCLDSSSAEKAARFVRMCDALGVPLIVLVDVPGYLPGVGQEWDGVVRRGAKLLHAFAEATVPRITLVTRKAYGGAYLAMNSRSLGATRVFAWPTATVAVMGAVAAVRILHRRHLAEVAEEDHTQVENELAAEHEILAGGLPRAVEIDVVDEIIEPQRTRTAIAAAITAAPQRRGNHGNIPL
jgi:acetyl-CoA/propionyl-CoA carboxylase carboxyl transferase subunit